MAASGAEGNVIPLREADESPAKVSLLQAISESEALPPFLSARSVPSWLQFAGLVLIIVGVAASFHFAPVTSWLVARLVFWFVFFMVVIWRVCLSVIGLGLRMAKGPGSHGTRPEEEASLPVYSILVALRDEATMMPQLSAYLSALDWPDGRLDVLLLIEEDDEETRASALAADFPACTRVLSVPAGKPLTKPRALNYGLAHAAGDYVAVYDAEDRPHPQQLREAYRALEDGPESLFCVQAPLVASNGSASWVAAHWSLEYAVQFGLQMPAIANYHHPLMLGGTSNHFRRTDLVLMGGWDAWNVTEDADLGIRIARFGGTCRAISRPTLETAPESFGVWRAQRSRWIKGYMQTWLVCMRQPLSLFAELGFVRWLSLQLMLAGAILSTFMYGPMTLLVMAGLIHPFFSVDAVSFSLFGLGWLGGAFAECVAPGRWSFTRLLAILTRPLYWPLQTLAGLIAVYGLAVHPAFWAKTPHQPEDADARTPCSPGS